tara:strand:+ start:391 stop:501 length:111 start_codon:yes stop_codon:yes gene_type:complete
MEKLLAVIKIDNLKVKEVLEKNGIKWISQPDQESFK